MRKQKKSGNKIFSQRYVKLMPLVFFNPIIFFGGWVELDKNTPQFEWVKAFKERFVDNLPDDARITIYECTRFED